MTTKPSAKARAVIDSINYITLATVDESGQPWNTPVAGFYNGDDNCLYWASWSDNQHSRNIRANGKVFIVIYDSTPPGEPTAGVYIIAQASELSDETAIMEAAKIFEGDPYNPSDGKEYMGAKPRRVYRATPKKIWMNADDEVNGDFIDIRTDAAE